MIHSTHSLEVNLRKLVGEGSCGICTKKSPPYMSGQDSGIKIEEKEIRGGGVWAVRGIKRVGLQLAG